MACGPRCFWAGTRSCWPPHPRMARRARDHAEANAGGGLPPGDPLAAKLDWLPGDLTMLSVADTAHSVYPELVVGAAGPRGVLLAQPETHAFCFIHERIAL